LELTYIFHRELPSTPSILAYGNAFEVSESTMTPILISTPKSMSFAVIGKSYNASKDRRRMAHWTMTILMRMRVIGCQS